MPRPDETFPSPVEMPEDGVDQTELPLVGDVQPTEPMPDDDLTQTPEEDRGGLPPIPA